MKIIVLFRMWKRFQTFASWIRIYIHTYICKIYFVHRNRKQKFKLSMKSEYSLLKKIAFFDQLKLWEAISQRCPFSNNIKNENATGKIFFNAIFLLKIICFHLVIRNLLSGICIRHLKKCIRIRFVTLFMKKAYFKIPKWFQERHFCHVEYVAFLTNDLKHVDTNTNKW